MFDMLCETGVGSEQRWIMNLSASTWIHIRIVTLRLQDFKISHVRHDANWTSDDLREFAIGLELNDWTVKGCTNCMFFDNGETYWRIVYSLSCVDNRWTLSTPRGRMILPNIASCDGKVGSPMIVSNSIRHGTARKDVVSFQAPSQPSNLWNSSKHTGGGVLKERRLRTYV